MNGPGASSGKLLVARTVDDVVILGIALGGLGCTLAKNPNPQILACWTQTVRKSEIAVAAILPKCGTPAMSGVFNGTALAISVASSACNDGSGGSGTQTHYSLLAVNTTALPRQVIAVTFGTERRWVDLGSLEAAHADLQTASDAVSHVNLEASRRLEVGRLLTGLSVLGTSANGTPCGPSEHLAAPSYLAETTWSGGEPTPVGFYLWSANTLRICR